MNSCKSSNNPKCLWLWTKIRSILSPETTETEEELDWTVWKKDIPFWKHALAGSCAGISEHMTFFPIDTIKTRLQSRTADSTKLTLKRIIKNIMIQNSSKASTVSGATTSLGPAAIRSFYRGFRAISTGCVPAHAALFFIYEYGKRTFGTDSVLLTSLYGGLATMSHDLILTPIDVVKQRLQLGFYNGFLHCVKSILKTEGLASFYRSFSTTVFMNVPYGAIFVTTNERIKRRAKHPLRLRDYFKNAAIAGGTAGFFTTPLDVIKTRLQTQQLQRVLAQNNIVVTPIKYRTFFSTMRTIAAEEGLLAFWKGAMPRLIISAPAAAICWGTYESVKMLLHKLEHPTIIPSSKL